MADAQDTKTAEPASLKKAVDVSPTALVKSTSVVIKGLLVLGAVFLFGLGVWVVIRPHFIKPQPTTSIGNAGVVNQDCSLQVSQAIAQWEKDNKKAEPWIKLRLWKIAEIRLGGT